MVELRKRKTPPPAPVRPTKKKAAPKPKTTKSKGAVAETVEALTESVTERVGAAAEAITGAVSGKSNGANAGTPAVGDTIDLTGFGDEVETNDGTKTTLAKLVEESKSGVVLFTYPKASTPGCKSPLPCSIAGHCANKIFSWQARPKHACSAMHMSPSQRPA